jgi:hypothetical protein
MRTLTMKEEKRLEVIQNSLSGRADGGGGGDDDRSQLAARYGRLFPLAKGTIERLSQPF